MIVDLLTADGSWIVPYLETLSDWCTARGDRSRMYTNHKEVRGGDVLFILGYLKIIPKKYRDLYGKALVIHESDLPSGRGFAPMSWQISEGAQEIVFTLFEADDGVDTGPIYFKKTLLLSGTELFPEWRKKQGELTIRMAKRFLQSYGEVKPSQQEGDGSYFEKRSSKDDEMLVTMTLAECFDRIRVCDPERYPAWFQYRGRKFKVLVEPLSEE